MPLNILILPLLGGYLFLYFYHDTRFGLNRSRGRRVLLDSARIGILLLVVSRCSVLIVAELLPSLAIWWKQLAPFAYSGTGFLSAFIGFISGLMGNAILGGKASRELPENVRSRASDPARLLAIVRDVERESNHVEGTILTCWSENRPMMVGTKQKKIYVGVPKHGPEPHERRRELAMLPLLSGYRDNETQEVHFTTTYADVYEELADESDPPVNPGDFVTVIPLEEISTLAVFDFDAYERFQQRSTGEEPERTELQVSKRWITNFT